jgi:hypothetical protein
VRAGSYEATGPVMVCGDGTACRSEDNRVGVRQFWGQSRHRDLGQRGSAWNTSRAT